MSNSGLFACAEIECPSLEGANVADCERDHCPFAHQRRREEEAIERERKDQEVKEARDEA